MNTNSSKPRKVASILMSMAKAHHQAFFACFEYSDSIEKDNADWVFIRIVSVSQLLLSIEQSLKVMLYWHDRRIEKTHDILKLYERAKSSAQTRISGWEVVIRRANKIAKENNVPQITDHDIEYLIDRVKGLYSDIRYGVDIKGQIASWSFTNREIRVLACFSLGLLGANGKLLEAEGIGRGRLARLSESEITPDQQRAVDNLRKRSK